ncbi:MAG: NUDIX domain-containing protein [Micropepsaceae bacterium]
MSSHATRNTARAVLLAPDNRILLFEFHLPAGFIAEGPRRFWATPGGEIESGEDARQALEREVQEETGIGGCEFGPELWFGSNLLTFKGTPTRMLERFFLVRSPVASLGATSWTEIEKEVMRQHKWWTVQELLTTPETVFPPMLGYWLDAFLRQGTAERQEIPL